MARPVEKETVEKIVEREVVKEVPVEKIVEREVIKQVPVEKIVKVVDPATAQLLKNLQDKYNQLESDYAESNKYIEEQNRQIQELRESGKVEIRDHTGNLINIHVPGQEPKPAPKRKLGQQEVAIPDLSINAAQENPTNAGFGTKFPTDPGKGDIFLRVDYLPSRLYKWNEKQWIEIDKQTTDRYAYDEQYIKHLAEKVTSGEYDPELLTDSEQEQIQRYNDGNTNQQ